MAKWCVKRDGDGNPCGAGFIDPTGVPVGDQYNEPQKDIIKIIEANRRVSTRDPMLDIDPENMGADTLKAVLKFLQKRFETDA